MKTEKTTEKTATEALAEKAKETITPESEKSTWATMQESMTPEDVRMNELEMLVSMLMNCLRPDRPADEICKLVKAVVEIQIHRATLLNPPAAARPDVEQLSGVFNTIGLLQSRIAQLEQLLGEPVPEPEDNGRERAIRALPKLPKIPEA